MRVYDEPTHTLLCEKLAAAETLLLKKHNTRYPYSTTDIQTTGVYLELDEPIPELTFRPEYSEGTVTLKNIIRISYRFGDVGATPYVHVAEYSPRIRGFSCRVAPTCEYYKAIEPYTDRLLKLIDDCINSGLPTINVCDDLDEYTKMYYAISELKEPKIQDIDSQLRRFISACNRDKNIFIVLDRLLNEKGILFNNDAEIDALIKNILATPKYHTPEVLVSAISKFFINVVKPVAFEFRGNLYLGTHRYRGYNVANLFGATHYYLADYTGLREFYTLATASCEVLSGIQWVKF
ncbi:hypothetical protein HNP86_001825 [Methanococcus maripaludis]|uniref:Uncharacterized protein n=1 Tax=Methanococcus maripaludis TaxID=39152 RepID=A0A7J9P0V7_METMI|nr:hypothetical protein [Methanococcus maripaludis]MBA2851666.1 hypothetical protein [Methanococcus maripaludis]